MTQRSTLLAILAMFFFAACGGESYHVGKPWNDEDARFFDDGVDLIENPGITTGIFGFQQKDLLNGRVQLSDFVAIVTVQTVRTTTFSDRSEIKFVDVTIEKTLYGNRPEKKLSLRSEPSSTGYALVSRHEASLSGRFILFSRWFEETSANPSSPKTIARHFHLTPASSRMLTEVKLGLARRSQLE